MADCVEKLAGITLHDVASVDKECTSNWGQHGNIAGSGVYVQPGNIIVCQQC